MRYRVNLLQVVTKFLKLKKTPLNNLLTLSIFTIKSNPVLFSYIILSRLIPLHEAFKLKLFIKFISNCRNLFLCVYNSKKI